MWKRELWDEPARERHALNSTVQCTHSDTSPSRGGGSDLGEDDDDGFVKKRVGANRIFASAKNSVSIISTICERTRVVYAIF